MARTAGRRTCETLASDPGQADQTGSAGGARKPGPGRQIVSQDNTSASAESKVRPGPRPLTLRPHHRKTAEAGPDALSTVSLPNISYRPWSLVLTTSSADHPIPGGAGEGCSAGGNTQACRPKRASSTVWASASSGTGGRAAIAPALR